MLALCCPTPNLNRKPKRGIEEGMKPWAVPTRPKVAIPSGSLLYCTHTVSLLYFILLLWQGAELGVLVGREYRDRSGLHYDLLYRLSLCLLHWENKHIVQDLFNTHTHTHTHIHNTDILYRRTGPFQHSMCGQSLSHTWMNVCTYTHMHKHTYTCAHCSAPYLS